MTSALLWSGSAGGQTGISVDLQKAGIRSYAVGDCTELVQAALTFSPNVCIICDENPGTALFESIAAVGRYRPVPVIVFTTNPDAEKMAIAVQAGVHAYVVNGYRAERLRAIIHVAQARFRFNQQIQGELADTTKRFEERKLVDRAKGILMGARQLREDEAYRALRRAAMDAKQRIGQISEQVIESARYAEAINRAGQLRMLSQRFVKLYALCCAGIAGAETSGLVTESTAQIDGNLDVLRRALSRATFGDLLDAVLSPWVAMRAALDGPPQTGQLLAIDTLAEAVLNQAETLTENLEIAGFAAALHVINVCGRQRMLSQRLAKSALLAVLVPDAGPWAGVARVAETELVDGSIYLQAMPMTNVAIVTELTAAAGTWALYQEALKRAASRQGKLSIEQLSEAMLGHFDRLTSEVERGTHALIR